MHRESLPPFRRLACRMFPSLSVPYLAAWPTWESTQALEKFSAGLSTVCIRLPFNYVVVIMSIMISDRRCRFDDMVWYRHNLRPFLSRYEGAGPRSQKTPLLDKNAAIRRLLRYFYVLYHLLCGYTILYYRQFCC
jgi:hypothetical protein